MLGSLEQGCAEAAAGGMLKTEDGDGDLSPTELLEPNQELLKEQTNLSSVFHKLSLAWNRMTQVGI